MLVAMTAATTVAVSADSMVYGKDVMLVEKTAGTWVAAWEKKKVLWMVVSMAVLKVESKVEMRVASKVEQMAVPKVELLAESKVEQMAAWKDAI